MSDSKGNESLNAAHDTLSAAIALKNSSTNTTVRPHATRRVSATAYDLERKMRHAAMTGVAYMVPFVAAGGLLFALGFLLGGYDIAAGWQAIAIQHSFTDLPSHDVVIDIATGQSHHFQRSGLFLYLGAVAFAIGSMSMQFIVAALSEYITFAIAGRSGIAPGYIGGAVSVFVGAGFLGGLVTGLLSGTLAWWLSTRRVPALISSLIPVVIVPLISSLLVGLIMFLVLGKPLSLLLLSLQNWLAGLSGFSAIILGAVLGLMMGFDLGGPVNKAAYLFVTAGLSTNEPAALHIMAAVMVAGMLPPIALSLATIMDKKVFTDTERENGKSAWLLGLSFISEGAIPFYRR